MLDLDGFKQVNDSRGHQAGDNLLVAVCGRLHAALNPSDFAARLGGDEYAVLLRDIQGVADLRQRIAQLRRVLQPCYDLPDGPINLTTSMGWALFPHEVGTVSDLMKIADEAMYNNKRAVFSPQA